MSTEETNVPEQVPEVVEGPSEEQVEESPSSNETESTSSSESRDTSNDENETSSSGSSDSESNDELSSEEKDVERADSTPDETEEDTPDSKDSKSTKDSTEKTLLFFLYAGIFPLFGLGWIMGSFYSFFANKTKPVHKKLQKKLLNLSAAFLFATIIILLGTFALLNDGTRRIHSDRTQVRTPTDLKTRTCGDYTFEYIERKRHRGNNVVFLLSNLDKSWHEHGVFDFPENYDFNVLAINLKDEKLLDGKYDKVVDSVLNCFNLKTVPFKTLVAEFSDTNFKEFNNDKYEYEWKNVLAINHEVECNSNSVKTTNNGEMTYPVRHVRTHVGVSNHTVKCQGKVVKFPVQITENGVNTYHKRNEKFNDILTSFFNVTPTVKERCFRSKKTSEDTAKFLDELIEPLDDFLGYIHYATGSNSLINAALCSKAL